MKIRNYLAILLLAFFATSSFAAEQDSIRDRVAKFLETNKVMEKTQVVSTKGTIKADGEEFLVEFSATITWSGLEKTADGLIFEETRDIKQSNTKVDANGNPLADPVKNDRIITRHIAVSERDVTKSLVGLTTITKSSVDDPTGLGFTTMIEISDDNKELFIYDSMAGFAEVSLDGKRITPVSTASSATMFVNDEGKLQTDETMKFYKVDINKDFAREEINRFNLTAIEKTR